MRKSLRSLRYFTNFDRLIRHREESGITLKRMADLTADISLGYPDMFCEVSEEELKAVEDDKRHGLSIAAVMYARILGSAISVSPPPSYDPETWDRIQKRMWERGTAKADREHARLLNMPDDAVVTSVCIRYEHDGAKHSVYVSMNEQDEAYQAIRDILLEHLEAVIADAGRGREAMKERYSMLLEAARK